MTTVNLNGNFKYQALQVAEVFKPANTKVFSKLLDNSKLPEITKDLYTQGYDALVFNGGSYETAREVVSMFTSQFPNFLKVVIYQYP
jgi:hypothetical protein